MQILSALSHEMQIFFVVILGLIFGSFGTLVSYRLAKKEPIVFTRSKCLNCGYLLKPWNLIPIFSWVFQGGKCSSCGAKISLRYPLIESSFVASFLTIYFVLGHSFDAKTFLHFAIAATLIVMIVTDLEEYFIPDVTQYFLTILVTILIILQGGTASVGSHVFAAFVYLFSGIGLWLFFRYAAGIDALGIDDLKFFFIAGFALGTKNFLAFMLLSGLFGLVFGGLWQKIKKDETFPFAPAICFAFFICLLFADKINPVDLLGSTLFFHGLQGL